MIVRDKIYGQFKITEPVLIELIKSKPVQRLKGIDQWLAPELNLFDGFSRYEHSIGVLLLLKRFKRPLEEQVAGLLHDIAHPVFSHVIDWVYGHEENEDYHEKNVLKFVLKSEIPEIIKTYGFPLERILDSSNFKSLEREIPDLCADRIDYALREYHCWAAPEIVKPCIDNLTIYENNFGFTSIALAKKFSLTFLKCQTEHWSADIQVLRFYLLSKLLSLAVHDGILSESDFFKQDKFVLQKLHEARDPKIQNILKELKISKINPRGRPLHLKKKFRYVDPLVLKGSKLCRLSDLDSGFKKELAMQKKLKEKGVSVYLPRNLVLT